VIRIGDNMEESKEAVTTESAPVTETTETKEVVNTPEVTTEQAQTTPAEETTQTVPAVNLDVDEYGVPWKNRAMEWKRKSEETIEKLPNLIDEAVKGSFQQYGKPQEKEYTIAELEQFAQNQPEHRPWVEEQKALAIERQTIKKVEDKFKAQDYEREAQRIKAQTFNYVAQTYPDAFVRNQQGQLIGMNEKNPMVSEINTLMRDPRLARDPEGFAFAADIAYARINRMNQGQVQQKENKLKAEVKHLQKQTLVEGGSKSNVQAVPAHRIALDKAKKTGSLKDAAAALKALAEFKKASMEK
jgi:hypothetical protein